MLIKATLMSRSIRVLVVEDDRDILWLVLRHLRSNDFVPNGFTNPVEALEEFEGDPHRYTVLLTDVVMPKMSGIELGREMLKINPKLKVIMMTAREDLDEFGDLPVVSIDDIIRKPFKLTDICKKVKQRINAT